MGKIINSFGFLITDFAHQISSIRYSLLSTDFWLTKVIIIVSAVFFFFFMILEIKKKKLAVATMSLLLIVAVCSAGAFTQLQARRFEFSYNETSEHDRILIKNSSESTLIEISSSTKSLSYETLYYLDENEILYLDNYFIVSYNAKSLEALEILFSRIYVKNLFLPAPKSDDQTAVYGDLLKLKDTYKLNIIPYDEEEALLLSDFYVFPIYFDSNERFAMTILYENEFYTYLTADMLNTASVDHALKIMNGANTVIIGSKGNLGNSYDFIFKIDKPTRLIYNKKTGLSDEILDYYENRIIIDPNGTVNLYVE